METKKVLLELKEKSNMNMREFAEYFGIPYRTVQDWMSGKRNISGYLLRLMIYKLKMEQLID